ncbi:hypothetical protein LTR15_011472 [Elasticomyces elasticus]|nr:hypothetical protein LTR15_011472 [Elasticomyces elasticus]
MVELLLENGARLDSADASRRTPLHLAFQFGGPHLASAALLHNAGADLEARDHRGYTALLHAVDSCVSEDAVSWLIERNADVNVDAGVERNALQSAAFWAMSGIADLLLHAGADPNFSTPMSPRVPLVHVMSCTVGRELMVTLLLAAGARLDFRGHSDMSPLMAAVVEDVETRIDVGMVDLLIDAATKLGTPFTPNALSEALSQVWLYNEHVFQSLVAAGADPNVPIKVQGSEKITSPLNLACGDFIHARKTTEENIEFLVRHGANVTLTDTNGDTALHAAASWGNLDVLAALISAKALVDVQNAKGQTPLQLACKAFSYDQKRDAQFERDYYPKDLSTLNTRDLGGYRMMQEGIIWNGFGVLYSPTALA